jgi:hypothetical protein
MEAIYERPRDYDLEHEGDDEDVALYLQLLARWQPRRVIELAAGSGRVTIPLARAAAARGIHIPAEIRFLYDKFPDSSHVDRYVSDFDCHVYYPREVELLSGSPDFALRRGSVTTRCGAFSRRVGS